MVARGPHKESDRLMGKQQVRERQLDHLHPIAMVGIVHPLRSTLLMVPGGVRGATKKVSCRDVACR